MDHTEENQPQNGERSRERRIGVLEVVVAAVVYLIVQFVGGGVMAVALGLTSAEDLNATGPALLLVALSGVAAVVAALVALALRVRSLEALGLRATTGRWVAIGVGVGILAFVVNRLIIVLYVAITSDSSNPQQGMADVATGGTALQFVLILILGGLLAPFGEEMLFRGVLFGWVRRWGFVLAALVSAVVFGLAHGLNVVFPAAVLLGLLNAYLYEKSGSIWPSIAAHATNNILVFAIARIVVATGLMPGG